MVQISLIIPVYNEEEMVPVFFNRVEKVLGGHFSYEYVFVNDGSRDATLKVLKALAEKYKHVKVISLSRNFGKEAAVTAGLSEAGGETSVVLDVDLQDPVELIPAFWEKYQQGYENVYGLRSDRSEDTFFKRFTAQFFYKVYNKLADFPIPYNAGDFRLLSRRASQAVVSLPERDRFMKGLFSWVGYKSVAVPYSRASRVAGKSKWNYWQLWNFALGGITSATSLPLKLWTYAGVFMAFLAFMFALWIAYQKLVWGNPVSGYASIMVTILFFSGLQLITLGIIGEYLSRIFVEVKQRPPYLIDEKINF